RRRVPEPFPPFGAGIPRDMDSPAVVDLDGRAGVGARFEDPVVLVHPDGRPEAPAPVRRSCEDDVPDAALEDLPPGDVEFAPGPERERGPAAGARLLVVHDGAGPEAPAPVARAGDADSRAPVRVPPVDP